MPQMAAFYSIKDGKTSSRRIQQGITRSTTSTSPAPRTTPSPVLSSTLLDNPDQEASSTGALQLAGGVDMSSNETPTKVDESTETIQQQHLTLSSINQLLSGVETATENGQSQNGSEAEPETRPMIALTTATGSPLSSLNPSSLSMNLDGMIMNTRPRAATTNASSPRTSDSSNGSGASNTAKVSQAQGKGKLARIGDSAKGSRRVPLPGVILSSPVSKSQRAKGKQVEEDARAEQEVPQVSTQANNRQSEVGTEQSLSGPLMPMDARGLEFMSSLLSKPNWRNFETQSRQVSATGNPQQQQQQQSSAGGNANDELVMSVMSSADGKDRRLVMISRDSLNSLQQLAKQQMQARQQQTPSGAPQQTSNVGQQFLKASTVGQQAGGSSTRWQPSPVAQTEVQPQTTTQAPPTSSLSSVFVDEPATTTALSQASASTSGNIPTAPSLSSVGRQTPDAGSVTTTVSSNTTAPSESAEPSSTPSQTKAGNTFREVPVSQNDSNGSVKRTQSGKSVNKQGSKGKSSTKSGSQKRAKSNKSAGRAGGSMSNSTLKSSSRRTSTNKQPKQVSLSQVAPRRPEAELINEEPRVPTSETPKVPPQQVVPAAQMDPRQAALISEMDRMDALRAAIPGEPRLDYPIYAAPPKTSFDCMAQSCPGGYYADLESQCQVFHICQNDGRFDTFLCPNGTIFSQQHFVCVWWWQVDCLQSPSFYKLNDAIYCNSNVPAGMSASRQQSQQVAGRQQDNSLDSGSGFARDQEEPQSSSGSRGANQAGVEATTTMTSSMEVISSGGQTVMSGASASLTGADSASPMRLQEQPGLAELDQPNQQQQQLELRKARRA